MFTILFFTTLYISQFVCIDYSGYSDLVLRDETYSYEQNPSSESLEKVDSTTRFPNGIVYYRIDESSYDAIITNRIHAAMELIEASSCVVFKPLMVPIQGPKGSWIHFTNPYDIRECVHTPGFGDAGEIIIVLGFECLTSRYVLHAVLHGIGFKDEVSHPQREQYIRIIWQNIQPRYRDLFAVQQQDPQYKMVEYDPMSVMHFHDRAFSLNGGPTIAPRVPGLHIKPSAKLSQLDVMKLRMWFGHECNKRKVGAVLEKCKTVLHTGQFKNQQNLKGENDDVSVGVDDLQDPYQKKRGPKQINYENRSGGDAENGVGDEANGSGGVAENGGGSDEANEGGGDEVFGSGGDETNGDGGDSENGGGGDEANGDDGDAENEDGNDIENGGGDDEGNGGDDNEENADNKDEMNEVDDEINEVDDGTNAGDAGANGDDRLKL